MLADLTLSCFLQLSTRLLSRLRKMLPRKIHRMEWRVGSRRYRRRRIIQPLSGFRRLRHHDRATDAVKPVILSSPAIH